MIRGVFVVAAVAVPTDNAAMSSAREIWMLGFVDAQILDITGPLEVFAVASRLAEVAGSAPLYRTRLVAPQPGAFRTSGGVELVAHSGLGGLDGAPHTLMVAGGAGVDAAMASSEVVDWVRRTSRGARRTASVCTGALLLAEAGLLDGRRAVTHWVACERMARRYPQVTVIPDAIYTRDGDVWTSAGVTSGMDLALALVEEDHGRDLALTVARRLVLFLKRPGGQSQFSATLAAQAAENRRIADLQVWVLSHPGADLSVEALSRRVSMSPRNFSRVFAREVGATPGRWVEKARVEAARRRLEDGEGGVEEIADACGFGTSETMRRAFLRNLGVAPSQYRSRFRSPASAA
jgi:transcriptional regulator GlxA family with amidase domain